MKHLLLSLFCLLACFTASAEDFTYEYEGQTLTYTIIDEEAKTCKVKEGASPNPGNNVSGDLIIPAEVQYLGHHYKVTEIGSNAFLGCFRLISVIISDGVTVIGEGAFASCSGLTSIAIPNSVTKIGKLAFVFCI